MLNETVKVVVAGAVASSCVTHLTLFNHIQFWDQYSTNQELIFLEMNKEEQRMILSNNGRIKSRRLYHVW